MIKRRVEELLYENRLSQTELAEKINITQATLSRNLNGLNPPRAEIVCQIAKVFNVTTDYLLGLSDKKYPDNEKAPDINSSPILYALYGEVKELTEEQIKQITEFAKFLKTQKENK